MALWEALDALPKLLSEYTGAEISGARLFATLLYVYPIAIIQRTALHGANANVHHMYNTLISAFLLYYNLGITSFHFLANTLLAYVIMVTLKTSQQAVVASIVVNMAYIFYAYLEQAALGDRYVINWSTPHCVLTLKLIGVQWDVYDGAQKDTKGKEETAVSEVPTLLELLGFAYYTPSLMTGPQISFKKYKQFSEGAFDQHMTGNGSYALQRMILGVVLIVSYPLLSPYMPTDNFYTQDYKDSLLITKVVLLALWGQIVLNRYLGVWLVAEGTCVLSGIAYNGKDKDGVTQWNGSANIKVERYFTATRLQHFVDSFNINTNKWVLRYIYKRLRFLNNRLISQGVSLFFLAIWHGFQTGYFMCFFLEFVMINGEKQISELLAKKEPLRSIVNQPFINFLLTAFYKLIATASLAYSLISFEQYYYSNYIQIYANSSYVFHIGFMLCPFVYVLLSMVLPDAKPAEKKE